MADKIVAFNDQKPGLGLPDPVEQRLGVRFGGGRTSPATPYLDIPAPDGNPSVGHSDVIVIEGGWNGYEYWMGYTPYPDEPRENPCVVASHDGVNWVIPDGLTNPIAPLSEAVANSFSYWSDTDLVHLPDGRLACYFRGPNDLNDHIVRKVTSDGVNWGPLETVLVGDATSALSPAIIVEDDGTLTMWTINGRLPQFSPDRLERRTSADGVNWSAPTVCTIPESALSVRGYIWHVDVVRVGDIYHALVATRDPYRLYHHWSKDGITWEGSTTPLPLTGHQFDQYGHYRSTLVALPGGKFDLWITGIDTPDGEVFTNAEWRIGLLRNVDLIALSNQSNGSSDVAPRWAWGTQADTVWGTPTSEVVGDLQVTKGLPAGEATGVACMFPPPPADWGVWAIDVIYTVPTGGADVRLGAMVQRMGAGSLIGWSPDDITIVETPASPNTVQFVEVKTFINNPPHGEAIRCVVHRTGAHAEDTLEESFRIIGMRLRRVS